MLRWVNTTPRSELSGLSSVLARIPDGPHERDAFLLPPARKLLRHFSVKRRVIGMHTLVGLSRAGGATFDALLRVAETVSCTDCCGCNGDATEGCCSSSSREDGSGSAHPEAAIDIASRTVDDSDAARRLESLHDEVGNAIKGDAPHSGLKFSSAAHCHTYPETVERHPAEDD